MDQEQVIAIPNMTWTKVSEQHDDLPSTSAHSVAATSLDSFFNPSASPTSTLDIRLITLVNEKEQKVFEPSKMFLPIRPLDRELDDDEVYEEEFTEDDMIITDDLSEIEIELDDLDFFDYTDGGDADLMGLDFADGSDEIGLDIDWEDDENWVSSMKSLMPAFLP